MLWYVLSQGQKTGPYGQSELVEMLSSEKISLDSYVMKQGSPVARKLFCSPEVLFPHILDESSIPTNKQHAKNGEAPPISAPTRIAEDLADEFQLKPKQRQKVQLKATAEADELAEKEAIKARARAEAALELKKHQERLRAAEAAKEEALRQVAILEAKERNKQKEQKQVAQAEAQLENELRRLKEEGSTPHAQFGESTTTTWRKKRKKIYPSNVANLQPKVVLEKQAPRKGPVPKQILEKRGKGSPPSHQLPKASSEALLRNQGDFTWAKNRVNLTAPKTVIQERTVKKHRRARKKVAGFSSKDLRLLGFGLALIVIVLSVVSFLSKEARRTKQPRFSLKTVTEQSTQPAEVPAVQFDDAQEVVVEAEKPKNREPEPFKEQKANAAAKKNENETQEKRLKQKPEGKAPERAKEKTVKKEPAQEKPTESTQVKARKKEKERKDKEKKQDTARLQARKLSSGSLPRTWSKYIAENGAQLQGGLFKVISISGIRLLQIPDFCQPCQVPAQLADGTRLLLTSQNTKMWKNIQRRGTTTVNAKGLVTRSSQGYFNVILQDLDP